jgi:tRNA(Ile)-lysidine synthase
LRGSARLNAPRLARNAAQQARRRAANDEQAAIWLACNARIDPAGFVLLAGDALGSAPPEIRRRAVQRAVMTVGGNPYPPRQTRLARLLEQLRAGLVSGRTLAGCRVLPWRGELLICREAQAIEEEALLAPGVPLRWDGRFRLELTGTLAALTVRPLGRAGTRALGVASRALPAPVRPSLPSLWRREQLLAVPHLGLVQPWLARRATITVRFNPASPLAGAPFHAHGSRTSRPLLRSAEILC